MPVWTTVLVAHPSLLRQALECGGLSCVRDVSRRGEVLGPVVLGEVRDRSVDFTDELVGRCAIGEALKVRRQRQAPVNTDLPRARFVGEEADAVRAVIDLAQELE